MLEIIERITVLIFAAILVGETVVGDINQNNEVGDIEHNITDHILIVGVKY